MKEEYSDPQIQHRAIPLDSHLNTEAVTPQNEPDPTHVEERLVLNQTLVFLQLRSHTGDL